MITGELGFGSGLYFSSSCKKDFTFHPLVPFIPPFCTFEFYTMCMYYFFKIHLFFKKLLEYSAFYSPIHI